MNILHKLEPTLIALFTPEAFKLVLAAVPHWKWEEETNPEFQSDQTFILCPDFLTPLPLRQLFGFTIESLDRALIEVCRTIVETERDDDWHGYVPNLVFEDFYPNEMMEIRKKLELGAEGIVIPDYADALVLNEILSRIGWRLQRTMSDSTPQTMSQTV